MREPITFQTIIQVDGSLFGFMAEASSLGLRPGEWPQALPVRKDVGNGLPFARPKARLNADGEIVSVAYVQDLGCLTLTVFND